MLVYDKPLARAAARYVIILKRRSDYHAAQPLAFERILDIRFWGA